MRGGAPRHRDPSRWRRLAPRFGQRTDGGRWLTPKAAVGLMMAVLGVGGAIALAPYRAGPQAHREDLVSAPLAAAPAPFLNLIPGMPAAVAGGVYAATGPGMLAPSVADQPQYLYVPNSSPKGPGVTWVIDQRTHKIVRTLQTGLLSQHVTPSYDFKVLYVEASLSGRLATIDPATGRMTGAIATDRPYNLYFTPDGKHAIVMDEQRQKLVWSDPKTFQSQDNVSDPSCRGPNHADFSADGRYLVVTCEFSGSLLKISTLDHQVVGRLKLPVHSKPQDVRLAPDGRTFYVADMGRDELLQIPWDDFKVAHEYRTLMMPHGIYPSRDQRFLYVSMRMSGAVQVFDLAKQRFTSTWRVPGHGTPDMGGLSADGKTLWLSGRFSGEVYGFDTATGKLAARIKVPGRMPHGLLVWPQPGRYSLGHTGNMR
ncbi:MAG: YncE family protein [Aeromicrobium sp.]